MKFCMVDDNGVITNIIVAQEDFAKTIGAVPAYDGANIGDLYAPPVPEPERTVWDELDAAYREGVDSV